MCEHVGFLLRQSQFIKEQFLTNSKPVGSSISVQPTSSLSISEMNPPGRKASEGDGETKVAYHTPATISVTVAYYHESSTVCETVFVLHLLHSLKERNLIWTSSFALIIRSITKQFYPRFTPDANYFPVLTRLEVVASTRG